MCFSSHIKSEVCFCVSHCLSSLNVNVTTLTVHWAQMFGWTSVQGTNCEYTFCDVSFLCSRPVGKKNTKKHKSIRNTLLVQASEIQCHERMKIFFFSFCIFTLSYVYMNRSKCPQAFFSFLLTSGQWPLNPFPLHPASGYGLVLTWCSGSLVT